MAAYTFTIIKEKIGVRLGNLPSSDPFYGQLGNWANKATNGTIMRVLSKNRRFYNLFPELEDKWQDTTVVNTPHLSRPTDALIITDIFQFKKTSANANTDNRYLLSRVEKRQWELLDKESKDSWPLSWVRYGNRLQIYPTPTASYVTDVLIHAIASENEMTGVSDTPVVHEMWHDAIVDFGVWLGATELGWKETAEEAIAACDQKIAMTVDISGLENVYAQPRVRVRGDVTE